MRDMLLAGILAIAVFAAVSARKAAQTKPVLVDTIIVVVDSGDKAEAVLKVLRDIVTAD